MGKSDYRTPSKEFGDSLKYDPTFRGPLGKRSCTDVICLLILLVFVAGWVAVGIYALINGDPVKLVTPVDSNGLRCGIDEGVTDKPYLFFFDLSQCVGASVLKGCRTPQVCVRECPKEDFLLDMNTGMNIAVLRRKMICLNESVNENITNYDKANEFQELHLCARYYLESREVTRRCIPKVDFIDKIVQNGFELLYSVVGNFTNDAKYHELGQKVVQDLDETWPFVVGGLCLAMILCFVYIVLMRWFAGVMVWLSLLGVIGLLAYCCYATYMKYDEMKSAEEKSEVARTKMRALARNARLTNIQDTFKDGVDEILSMRYTWLVFLIISAVALVIVLLLVIFLRNRIRIAIALIKEASKAVGSITSTLVFPLFPWILQLLVIGWFIVVLLFLAGSSVPIYVTQLGGSGCSCTLNNNEIVNDGDRCDPDNFSQCLTSCTNSTSTCVFGYYEKFKYIDYMHAYNVFGVFWLLFFISGIGDMILAATFATWYWTFKKKDVPFLALTRSIGRTFRYNLGTVAFGSLILAICRMIRVILEYLDHKLKKYDNAFVKAVLCCLRCFFWCLEKFIKFINKNAYIMCAVHGKNFCRSARDAFSLLMRNVIRVFVLDKVTDFLLFLGKLLITAGMCALAFFVFTKDIIYIDGVPSLNYSIIPVLFIGFGTYFIASIFFGVYSMAVDTLFLCFLEDCERNDGSPEKPYFMSKELMKILHKKNK